MSAIQINNVSFKYDKNYVINKCCANINENNIYALLGSSGCGKTTLLKLILGRLKPKYGSISVFGYKPGVANRSICYMPQDCALCLQFTVNQTFNYFVKVYRISNDNYIKRREKLHQVLDIPEGNKIISELSGGEQRRVSLALTLISDADKVILDEPTVGIDLIRTSRIWDYLFRRCEEGLTVLLVTQYVEEATYADRLGFIRNGKMLVEDKPTALINKYNERSLEKIFLKLCIIEDETPKNVTKLELQSNREENSVTCDKSLNKKLESFSEQQVWTTKLLVLIILIKRNFLKMSQMGAPALLVICLPALQSLFFCLIFSKELIQMKTAIFNEEIEPYYSQKLLTSLQVVDQHIIYPINYSSLEEAINGIHKNEVIGVIHFKQNYSQALDERIEDSFVDNETISESNLHVYLDNTIVTFGNYFTASLKNSLQKFLTEKKLTSIESAITVEKTVFSQNLLTQDYYLPGFVLHILYFSAMITSSLTLLAERKDGLFERSLIAGVSHELVFVSHLITNFLLTIIQILLMFLIIFVLFSSRNVGSITLIFFLFLAQAFNTIATGFLLSVIFNDAFVCLIAVNLIALPQLFSTGIIWPIESVGRPLRDFLFSSPLYLPINALKDIMFKGYDLLKVSVLFGFSVNLIPSLLYLLVAIFIFKRK